jgi:hypothetical protein
VPYRPIKHLPSIRKIPDELWVLVGDNTSTTGRPVISFRIVLDGILYILRTGCQWKMLQKNLVLVQLAIDDFNNGQYVKYFKNCG